MLCEASIAMHHSRRAITIGPNLSFTGNAFFLQVIALRRDMTILSPAKIFPRGNEHNSCVLLDHRFLDLEPVELFSSIP